MVKQKLLIRIIWQEAGIAYRCDIWKERNQHTEDMTEWCIPQLQTKTY